MLQTVPGIGPGRIAHDLAGGAICSASTVGQFASSCHEQPKKGAP
jgi:hypothetical protein